MTGRATPRLERAPVELPRLDARSDHLWAALFDITQRCPHDWCLIGAVDAVVDDSVGWPCLRFFSSKVRTEQLVPLSPKAAVALRAQAELVRRDWPAGTLEEIARLKQDNRQLRDQVARLHGERRAAKAHPRPARRPGS